MSEKRKPKFLADEDMNPRIAAGMRRIEPAVDFLSAHQGGTIGLSDSEVLRRAAESGRILVSCDRNTIRQEFHRFIARQKSPGLILVKQSLPIRDAIEELLLVWSASDAEEWENLDIFLPL